MARNTRIVGAIRPQLSKDYVPSPEMRAFERKVAEFTAATSGGPPMAPWPRRGTAESERDDDE